MLYENCGRYVVTLEPWILVGYDCIHSFCYQFFGFYWELLETVYHQSNGIVNEISLQCLIHITMWAGP